MSTGRPHGLQGPAVVRLDNCIACGAVTSPRSYSPGGLLRVRIDVQRRSGTRGVFIERATQVLVAQRLDADTVRSD